MPAARWNPSVHQGLPHNKQRQRVDDRDAVDDLAEEDLEIAGKKKKRKKRRLVKAGEASTPAPAGMTEEELKAKLFGRADLEDLEDEDVKDPAAREAVAMEEEEEDFDSQSSEEDEFRDFIDDTDALKQRVVTDDMDDEQKRIAVEKEEERIKRQRQKQRRRQKLRARTAGVSVRSHKDLQGMWLDCDDLVRRYEEMKIERIVVSRMVSTLTKSAGSSGVPKAAAAYSSGGDRPRHCRGSRRLVRVC